LRGLYFDTTPGHHCAPTINLPHPTACVTYPLYTPAINIVVTS